MALGVRTGGFTSDTITFVAHSDASDDVTVTLNTGESVVISVAVCGNDRTTPGPDTLSHMGYVGNDQITGLTPFTEYVYTATNGTDTVIGTCSTAATQGQKVKYAVGFYTCLQPATLSTRPRNAPEFLNWWKDQNPDFRYLGTIVPDDVCYPDAVSGYNDGVKEYDSDAPDWPQVGVELSEYNFTINYSNLYGVLSGQETLNNFQTQRLFNEGHLIPQAGDHEYWNNIWNPPTGQEVTTVPNPMHVGPGATFDGQARVAWNNFMKPLCGELFAVANTDSHHWSLDLGDMQIVSPDCVSNTVASGGTVTTGLGTDQITEILNKVDNNKSFKVFANPAWALRNDPGAANLFYKTEQYVQSEVERLCLDNSSSPSSLMLNPKTNGNIGCHIWLRGDWHQGKVWSFEKAASGSNLAESYYEVGLAAANGGRGGGSDAVDPIEYGTLPDNAAFAGGLYSVGSNHSVCVIITYDYTGDIPIMTVNRYEYNWKDDANQTQSIDANNGRIFVIEDDIGPDGLYCCTFRKKFAPFQGTNLGFDEDEDFNYVPPKIGFSDAY